jgi:ubiquinone biosynthesis protein
VEARNIAAVSATDTGTEVALPTVHTELSSKQVLVMCRLDGSPVRTAIGALDDERRDGLARALLDCVLRLLLHGVFHADPHPGNVLLLADGKLGLLDFGSVGRLDAALRGGLRDLLAAVDRGDPAGLRDGLLEIVDRPDEIDEQRLERALGALMAKHVSHGQAPDLDAERSLRSEHRLVHRPVRGGGRVPAVGPACDRRGVPRARDGGGHARAAVAGVQHHGGVAGVREQARRRAAAAGIVAPGRRGGADVSPLVLRRRPRRIDLVTSALERGRLSVNVRLFADERDRTVVTGMLHEVLLAFTGTATGVMAVLLLASTGGPRVSPDLTLNQLFGYNLLVMSALLGLRLLFVVFRSQRRNASTVQDTT